MNVLGLLAGILSAAAGPQIKKAEGFIVGQLQGSKAKQAFEAASGVAEPLVDNGDGTLTVHVTSPAVTTNNDGTLTINPAAAIQPSPLHVAAGQGLIASVLSEAETYALGLAETVIPSESDLESYLDGREDAIIAKATVGLPAEVVTWAEGFANEHSNEIVHMAYQKYLAAPGGAQHTAASPAVAA